LSLCTAACSAEAETGGSGKGNNFRSVHSLNSREEEMLIMLFGFNLLSSSFYVLCLKRAEFGVAGDFCIA